MLKPTCCKFPLTCQNVKLLCIPKFGWTKKRSNTVANLLLKTSEYWSSKRWSKTLHIRNGCVLKDFHLLKKDESKYDTGLSNWDLFSFETKQIKFEMFTSSVILSNCGPIYQKIIYTLHMIVYTFLEVENLKFSS